MWLERGKGAVCSDIELNSSKDVVPVIMEFSPLLNKDVFCVGSNCFFASSVILAGVGSF